MAKYEVGDKLKGTLSKAIILYVAEDLDKYDTQRYFIEVNPVGSSKKVYHAVDEMYLDKTYTKVDPFAVGSQYHLTGIHGVGGTAREIYIIKQDLGIDGEGERSFLVEVYPDKESGQSWFFSVMSEADLTSDGVEFAG